MSICSEANLASQALLPFWGVTLYPSGFLGHNYSALLQPRELSREITFYCGLTRFDFAYSGLNTKMKNFVCAFLTRIKIVVKVTRETVVWCKTDYFLPFACFVGSETCFFSFLFISFSRCSFLCRSSPSAFFAFLDKFIHLYKQYNITYS